MKSSEPGNAIDVTIVMPVFNTPEPLISRAVESVHSQSSGTWELVMVDDGSDARTAAFLDWLAAGSQHTAVIHQGNAGVAAARNVGIERARGRYVAFLDADDELLPMFIGDALDQALSHAADIVFGGIEIVHGEGRALWRSRSDDACPVIASLELRTEAIVRALSDEPGAGEATSVLSATNVVAALYSTDLARLVSFPVGVTQAEDRIFNARAISHAARPVVFCADPWYRYDQTLDSGATRSFSTRTVTELSRTVMSMAEIASMGSGLATSCPTVRRAAAGASFGYLKVMTGVAASLGDRAADRSTVRDVLNDGPVRRAMRSVRVSSLKDYSFLVAVRIRSTAAVAWLAGLWARSGGLGMVMAPTVDESNAGN